MPPTGMIVARAPIHLSSSGSWEKLELLWVASRRAGEEVVKPLLPQDHINPDKPDKKDKIPLSSTSSNGDLGLVRLRLERDDVNPNKPDNTDKTPLYGATCDAHVGAVNLLFAREDVTPDKPDKSSCQ